MITLLPEPVGDRERAAALVAKRRLERRAESHLRRKSATWKFVFAVALVAILGGLAALGMR